MEAELYVGFPFIDRRRWAGGYNYLLNLCRVLEAYGTGRVRSVLFVGRDTPGEDTAPFQKLGVSVVVSALFNQERKKQTLMSALLLGLDPAVERVFRESGIGLVFESALFFGWRSKVPAVAWFPDFQHRRLRHFFGIAGYWKRELGFRAQIWSGRTILLSSQAAANDCAEFYRIPPNRVVVVPFAVMPPPSAVTIDVGAIRLKYGLPERFFYLPNQFYQHKNHALVIEALRLLKQRGSAPVVVASGARDDLRMPHYFDLLLGSVRELGLEEHLRFLDVIPYDDVVGLMRGCIAVINPSLFEGWSSTVEEAKSLGVSLLLSDLAVHREQAPARAIFFDPTKVEDLAAALSEAESRFAEKPCESEVSAETARRIGEFAARFEALAIQAARHRIGAQ